LKTGLVVMALKVKRDRDGFNTEFLLFAPLSQYWYPSSVADDPKLTQFGRVQLGITAL
jgi:hypothetical protein